MKKILFTLLMVLCVPSVYSQVIKYKGIEVDGGINKFERSLYQKCGAEWLFLRDNNTHIFNYKGRYVYVLENTITKKLWRVVEAFEYSDFSSAKSKFISLYDAISSSGNYILSNDFNEKDVDGEYHDTNKYNIKRNSMYLGSSFWYNYTLKGTTNQDIQVTLLMQGTDYIVLVYYQNGNNKEIEEF